MAKINVRDRNKNVPNKKPNWEYRFEAAKVDGKRKHISKSGFRTKKEALEAGTKALAEYNNAGLHFEPSEISVSDYLDYYFDQYVGIAFDFHSLRHTHATRMIEGNVSPVTVKDRLGHQDIKTTLQTYTHSTDQMESDAVDMFEKITKGV